MKHQIPGASCATPPERVAGKCEASRGRASLVKRENRSMTDAQGIPRRTIIKSYSRRGNYSTLAKVGLSSHARRPIVNVSKLNTESRSTTDVHRGYSRRHFARDFCSLARGTIISVGPGTSPRACRPTSPRANSAFRIRNSLSRSTWIFPRTGLPGIWVSGR